VRAVAVGVGGRSLVARAKLGNQGLVARASRLLRGGRRGAAQGARGGLRAFATQHKVFLEHFRFCVYLEGHSLQMNSIF
jgi:hypothetical protein